jgi:protein-S-isoprenylcysteine O-methyltransferase Ste14
MKIRIRIQGFLIVLTTAVIILFINVLFPQWQREAPDEFLDALGMSLVLFGFLIRIAARGHKSEKSGEGTKLVTDGLYGLFRHPMYFGTLLIGIGIIIVLFKWWILLLFLIAFLFIYIPLIRREENKLLACFGEAYRNYCRTTAQWSYDILKLFKINSRDHLFFKWSWIKKELPSLIATIVAITAIEVWEDVRLFGYIEVKKELLEFLLIIVIFVLSSTLFYKKEYVSDPGKSN